jgi:transcriptional regulator with XRE-family HTH domain
VRTTITSDQLQCAGQRLEAYRRAHGRMTQRDLAGRVGLSVSLIQSLEAGTRATRRASLEQIAARLGMSIDELIAPDNPINVLHPDPRVAHLMPDDIDVAVLYARAPGPLKIQIRHLLDVHYNSIDPRYLDALDVVPGSYARKTAIGPRADNHEGE